MKAAICTAYGSADVLVNTELDRPRISEQEILVEVRYTAVTASDIAIRALEAPGDPSFPMKQLMRFGMRLFLGSRKPNNPVLGLVFSGDVVAVGSAIRSFKLGDKVFGFTGESRGAYAEYKKITEKEIAAGEIELIPQGANYKEAVALAYGGVLAQHFMKLQPSDKKQKILVYGASGAIGTIALQLAKFKGAEVTAVCSTANFNLVKSLGATKCLDYQNDKSTKHLETYDLIFDAVGKAKSSTLKESLKECLSETGVYRSVDDSLLKMAPDNLTKLKDLHRKGALKPVIDKVYPLSEIVEAHRYVEQGHKKGNVLIQI